MRMAFILLFFVFLLGWMWATSAWGKVRSFSEFSSGITDEIGDRLGTNLSIGIILSEGIVAVAILSRTSVKFPLLASVLMLTVFSLRNAWHYATGSQKPCNCFGSHETTTPARTLARSTSWAALSAILAMILWLQSSLLHDIHDLPLSSVIVLFAISGIAWLGCFALSQQRLRFMIHGTGV